MSSDRNTGAYSRFHANGEAFDDDNKTSPEERLAASVGDLARANRFPFYLVATFPSADRPELAENIIIKNWPDALYQAYAAAGVFHASQLVAALRETSLPVLASAAEFDADPKGRQSLASSLAFERQGFATTFAFAPHDAKGRRYLLALSGKREPLANIASLFYDGTRYLDSFSREKNEETAKPLSAREAECLTWSAAGKSSEEIAVILGISPHTVNFYLQGTMRKLGCANRMQAVARALRLRLI